VRALKQPIARLLLRGALIAAVSACSLSAWGQGTGQGGAAPPTKSSATPPPADLEPGVNTSATQTSSPEPASTPPPAAAPTAKPAQTSAKHVPANPAGAPAPGGAHGTGAAASTGTPKPGAPAGKAHDSIELDTTQITGNRELPKVLYIVPWKRSDLGDLEGKPVNSLLDEVLTPVDRDVFKRQNRYYDALKPDEAKDAAAPAAAPK
jgi:hypothetical protein